MIQKKGQGALMGVFITIILLVIIGSISMSFIQDNQELTDVTDDQFTGSNSSCTQITDNCINTLNDVENLTGTDPSTGNYSVCESTSGSTDTDGIILLDDNYNTETLNATYVEESCSRIKGIGGTVISYASVVLALAIFVFGAGFAMKK